MKRPKLFWRIFRLIFCISCVVVAGLMAQSIYALRSIQRGLLEKELAIAAATTSRLLRRDSGDLTAPGVKDLLRRQSTLSGRRYLVVSLNGIVVADSLKQPTSQIRALRDRPEIASALAGETSTAYRYCNDRQGKVVYAAAPIQVDDQIVGAVQLSAPPTLPAAHRYAVQVQLAAGVLAAAVIAVGISLLVSRMVTTPLRELQRATGKLADGDLGRKLPSYMTREMDSLANCINAMSAQLASRLDAIRDDHHELQAIVSSMIEGVMAVDGEQRVFKANQAAADILGVAPEELIGHPLGSVVRNAAIEDLIAQSLQSEQPVEGEVILYGAEEDRTVSFHGTKLSNGNGARRGAVIVLNDITRLRRLEAMRRQFASNVSHELKTPVTSIQGFVETLLDGTLEESPEDVRHFLEIILKQSKRLNAIMEDILLLSRIEQQDRSEVGRGFEQLAVDRVLRGALDPCRQSASAKGVTLLVECPDDVTVAAHPRLLEQAIVNLLTNAINYSPSGSTVTCRVEVGKNILKIHVIDNGCGISREHLDRLFERFYRVDKARSRQLGGTGLGLAIVKHIVQVHGGTVSVDSTLGKGSTFTVAIPLKQ